MLERTRTRVRQIPGGDSFYQNWLGGGHFQSAGTQNVYEQRMIDWHKKDKDEFGLMPPSPLYNDVIRRKVDRLHGEGGTVRLQNFTPTICRNHTPGHIIPDGRRKSDSAYTLELLSRTNPMRPEYSVPVAIKDLVEVVTMFKLAAKTLAGIGGSAYLNYRFGWLPFIEDIRTLSHITTAIERRVMEYQSMLKHGGLRRKVDLDRFPGVWSHPYLVSESVGGIWVAGPHFAKTDTKVWGTVRWMPETNVSIPLDPIHQFNLAVKQVFDLESPDASTIWELIPFSWLADYFTNFGDLFAAGEGRALVRPVHVCIMDESYTEAWSAITERNAGITGGDYFTRRWTTTRKVITSVTVEPTPLGFLTESQWKVIAALLSNFKR